MSKRKPALSLTVPVVPARKTTVPSAPRSRHTKRLEAEKQALLALEQSLRLQAYTIRLPRTHPLFSGKDLRRCFFPSSPLNIIKIRSCK